MEKRKLIIIIAIISIVACILGYFLIQKKTTNGFITEKLKKSTIIETVDASGTINPVKTVNIGSQVSGMISEIYVDFNSQVKKGQLLAQIDQSLFQAQVDKSQADLAAAKANYQKTKSTLDFDKKNYERYKNLYQKNYVSKSELDLAESTYLSNLSALNANNAIIKQTNATLQTNLANLRYSRIVSPVDGVVISRNVDVGQTVAASFQTPTLFMVAQDLDKMQIEVNVSEADIGRIKVGQSVDYTLDGYPDLILKGKVGQVRISPTTLQNVVTYTVVVAIDNEQGRLIPGMSANVSIITSKKDDILCAPLEALRYTPEETKGKGKGGGKKFKEQGIWVLDGSKPKRISIKTGSKDSSVAEIISDELSEGTEVIVGKKGEKGKKGSGQRPPMRMF